MLQITAVGLISVGIVLVLLLGEIDLSVGAVSGLCGGGHGGAQRQARLEPVPGDRRRRGGRRGDRPVPGLVLHAASASRRSWSRWPACWPGRARCSTCWATPARVNITTPKITGLAGTFYSDAIGWIMAVVVHRGLRGRRRCWGVPAAGRRPGCADHGARAGRGPHRGGGGGRRSRPSASSTRDRGLPLARADPGRLRRSACSTWPRGRAFGRHVFAVGGNAEAARRAGINVNRDPRRSCSRSPSAWRRSAASWPPRGCWR